MCRIEGKLSKTHVPPRAAGNVGTAQPAVLHFDETTGKSRIALGTAHDGGMWGWWLCKRCNNRTSRWEAEYRRWQVQIADAIAVHPEPAWKRLSIHDPNSDPGALVRVLWAWMFAIDKKLGWGWPDLAESVLTGEPTDPPTGLRLLLAASTSPRIAAAKPVRAQWTGEGWDAVAANAPRVAVSAPPFFVYLAADGTDPAPGSLDTEEWLRDRAGTRRAVDLELLIVDALTDADMERMQIGVPLSG